MTRRTRGTLAKRGKSLPCSLASLALGCSALSAMAACTADSPSDMSADAPGAPASGDVVSKVPGENQANFPIKKDVAPGDLMRTRCTWKNPTDAAMSFGEATGDEMCFDFLSYYPNIPDRTVLGLPLFTWITPSQSATCTTE